MNNAKSTEGQLFSHTYGLRGTPLKDSKLFRSRIGAYCALLCEKYNSSFAKYIKKETGLEINYVPAGYQIENYFNEIDIKFVLNSITLVWEFLRNIGQQHSALRWHEFITRVFREENMGYSLDKSCGVHYFVDEEFELKKISVLRCLDNEKYSGVKKAFEDAYKYLDSDTPDTKAAVRSVFESIEILAKQMVDTRRLTKSIVQKRLKNVALEVYKNDEIMCKVVNEVFDGFGNWVEAMHNCRHGQKLPEPVSPPIEFAIYTVSSGASFLRWLIEIDMKRN